MSAKAFLQKLAIERCQHNLAQLRAVTFLTPPENTDQDSGDFSSDMLTLLVENMNRDLEFLEKTLAGTLEDS